MISNSPVIPVLIAQRCPLKYREHRRPIFRYLFLGATTPAQPQADLAAEVFEVFETAELFFPDAVTQHPVESRDARKLLRMAMGGRKWGRTYSLLI
jgi:hypothetical protein